MSSAHNKAAAEQKMLQAEALLRSARQLSSLHNDEAKAVLHTNIIALLDEAVTLAPEDPKVYRRRSVAFALQNDFNAAWEEVRKAQKLDSGNPETYRLMVHLLKMCGNADVGIAYLLALSQTPLLLSPLLHLSLIELRLCRVAKEDIAKSEVLLNMLLEAPVFELRMQLRLWKELPKTAALQGIERLRESILKAEYSPTAGNLEQTTALALCDLSMKEVADAVTEQLCYPIVSLWEAQNALATLFLEKGDLQQAMSWVEQAEASAPQTAEVQLTKNCILLSKGQTAVAVSGFKQLADAPFVLGSVRKRARIMQQISGLTAHMTNN